MTDGSSCSKRKQKVIALDQKAAIIGAVASGTKKTQVAKDFGIVPSPLSTILSSKENSQHHWRCCTRRKRYAEEASVFLPLKQWKRHCSSGFRKHGLLICP
ncbi:hypothetical protein HPB49_001872 [Dermacentor silvarum]|uniref:Uncharacterized protein n=1 Tax=Dermacentor silvarum TaxID=543639 RepID=A0ACB8CNW4_DERSI|nr:hypothetical protein HPB49_001872 [Dermacentor silvarum]